MNLKNFLGIVYILTFVGCASLKTQVQNDPNYDAPNGKKVAISVKDKEYKDKSDTMLGKVIISEAKKWFTAKGYEVTDELKKADQTIYFGVDQQSKDVYVPAQTYSIPVYGNNNGTTTTVKGAYGQTLGTLETASSNPYAPTGYQTQYREGYNATVTDRWLFMSLYYQNHGKPPVMVSQGQVYPEKRDQQFFESPQVMAQAVSKLLEQSQLIANNRIPASVKSDKDPGCWPRLGIMFDEEKLNKGSKIKDFATSSKAQKSGLKIGDVIYSIGGEDVPLQKTGKYTEGKSVRVLASRDGKDFQTEVATVMLCIED